MDDRWRGGAALVGALLCGLLHEVSAMAPTGKETFRAGPGLGLPFSTAVRAGDLVYASGVLATDASGKIVPDDVREQTRRTLDNLKGSFAATERVSRTLALTRCDEARGPRPKS